MKQSTDVRLRAVSPFVWQMAALGAVLAVTLTAVILAPKPQKKFKPPTTAQVAHRERTRADVSFNAPDAKKVYGDFIDKWKNSPDKEVQDEVGSARIRLAYATAKTKDFEGARHILVDAAKEYKGTGMMGGDFGGLKDEAIYQAAACLSGEGKKAEARAAFVDFIKTQPLSPLVNAAYKRIVKIDGKSTPEIEALLQSAVSQQQKHVRFATSVCGPKAIIKLLEVLHSKAQQGDYKAVAKLCGTTDDGTTLAGMRSGLKAFGLDYFGYQVGRADLPRVETPAILYILDHFVVVTAVKNQLVTVYDPMTEKQRDIDYSKVPDDKYDVIMLLKSAPAGALTERTP